MIDYTFDMIELFFCDQRNKEEKIIIKMISDENNKRLLRINLDNENYKIEDIENLKERMYRKTCKLCLNGMPVPLLRNGYSIFNGTKYR